MSEPKTVQLPWQGLLALAAVVAGAVWYFAPLDTSRPQERTGFLLKLNRDQDVDARLWQDPLAPAFAHEQQVRAIDPEKDRVTPAKEASIHSVDALCKAIAAEVERDNDLLVMPVLVSGGAYVEYGENRLRARRAILEALGTNQLSPRDGEHIGYVRMPLLGSADGSSSEPPEYFVLPYEWCDPAFKGSSANQKKRVLILWVREEELNDKPLKGLEAILDVLKVNPRQVRIIGPRTSAALRAFVDEVTAADGNVPKLGGAVIFSPTATVSEDLLLRGHEAENESTVKALLEKKITRLTFHRLTLADNVVCRELITELGRRDVDLNYDHIALISEWDTFYGRALPLSFAHELSPWKLDSLSQQYPENIQAFHYLRGIDGMLPGASTQDQDAKSAKKTEQRERPRETIEGLNQADYLRRLAKKLEETNRKLIHNKGTRLKAVGVLGSDVYDKLLVLKALRPTLPGVLFFTNNLDARFGHADEWKWARNLIVASPFGLRLRDQWKGCGGSFDLQGKILPFRDAYQTATYAAALFASNDKAAALLDDQQQGAQYEERLQNLLGTPRLFEIGQSGPYELPARRCGPEQLDLHPVQAICWWNFGRRVFFALLCLSVAGLIVWIWLFVLGHTFRLFSAKPDGNDSTSQARQPKWAALRHFLVNEIGGGPSSVAFLKAALIAWGVVWALAYAQLPNGEPFVWMEGISIWPTETMRLFVVLMALWFFLKTNTSLKNNEGPISKQFGLESPKTKQREFAPFFSKQGWKDRKALASFGDWDAAPDFFDPPLSPGSESKSRIVAQTLWTRYIRAGRISVRLIRVVPLSLFFIGAGFSLILLLLHGLPPVPGRGSASFCWDRLFLALSILTSVGLTFYIADATTLNRHLIDYLVKCETKWPGYAYRYLRERWKASTIHKKSPAASPGLQRKQTEIDHYPSLLGWLRSRWYLRPFIPRPSTTKSENLPQEVDSGSLISKHSTEEVPPERLLDEYLDIDLIATRTEVVGGLIYYPFVLITLMIVSRISLFDNWTWPAGLFIVIAGNGGYAAWSAWMLRRAAEDARQRALKNLNDILIARTAEGDAKGAVAETARETIAMIKAEERGAFAAISRHPLIGALLLPSGGAGIWALTQYLPGLF